MHKKTSAQRLQQVMRERNLKQVDILEMSKPHQKRLGIKLSKGLLSKYVNGKSIPHQNSLHLLSKTLDVDPAWLMGYDLDAENEPNTDDEGSTQEHKDSSPGKATPSAKLAVKINRRKSPEWNELATDLLELSDDGVGQLIPVVKGLLAAEKIKKETSE